LRFKYKNQLKADLPFKVLVAAMLRRMSSLMNEYGGAEPPLDYKGMVFRANNVKTKASDIRWFDWHRYSNRQEQRMLMGGMIGSITFEGLLTEYLPILHFCEKVHVGKQTSFGLGRMEIDIS
jgi:CRISPR/Cas system endoribonuclease Cas6 (RAMP superfamily)